MKAVRVSELKASLSAYLARVKRGEEVVVTQRGKPIAKLVPLDAAELGSVSRLASLERLGVIRLGTAKLPSDFWKRPRPADPGGQSLASLLADREEGP